MERKQTRLCLECNRPLPKNGRTDKKFCDDECKNDYFNALKNAETKEISKIQNALKNNRRILKELLGKNDYLIIEKAVLLKLGFDFDYHTHHVISKTQQNEFIFSFNYGFRLMGNNQFKIVKSFK